MKAPRSALLVLVLLAAAGALLAAFAGSASTTAAKNNAKGRPIVIGHRGASGYRPEHTLASYRLAIAMGADYIEPDLVSTKDGVLVARHENEIGGTTDVASHPEFASRRVTKTIDGNAITGWFTEDFTLAELKTLFARERLPAVRPASTAFDGTERIPTFQEVIDLAQSAGVGIYPETKHPSYFDSIGLSLEEPLVRALDANGYRGRNSKVFVQSFETANLRQLATMTKVPLVQLLDAAGRPYDFVLAGDPRTYADLASPAGLAWIAAYADGVGVNKDLIVPRDATNHLRPPTALIANAHALKLIVHAWTFRRENTFLAEDFRQGNPASAQYPVATGNFPAELRYFLGLGLDGLFSDNPDVAVAVRSTL